MLVDFPAPFGPMYPTISPRSIEKLMRSTAATVRYSRTNRFWTEPQTPSRRLKLRKCLLRSWTWIRDSALIAARILASHPGNAPLASGEHGCAIRRENLGRVAPVLSLKILDC